MKKIMLLLLLPWLIWSEVRAQKINSPLKINRNTITLKDGDIELDKNGFPKQIKTFYNKSNVSTNLLFENIHFHFVRKSDGKNIVLNDAGIEFEKDYDKILNPKKIKWKAKSENDSLIVEVAGATDNHGIISYNVKVRALTYLDFKDVTMHIPLVKTVPSRMFGFGVALGDRPEKVEWKWNSAYKNQNGAWLGNNEAGIAYVLEKSNWSNDGKGGVTVGIKGGSMLANNYTREHGMKSGEIRNYNFQLVVRPVNAIH